RVRRALHARDRDGPGWDPGGRAAAGVGGAGAAAGRAAAARAGARRLPGGAAAAGSGRGRGDPGGIGPMTTDIGLPIRNRWAVAWQEVPIAAPGGFRDRVVAAVHAGARLVLLFGVPEEGRTRVVAVVADDDQGQLSVLTTQVGAGYPALTPDCPAAHAYERELAEQCGI